MAGTFSLQLSNIVSFVAAKPPAHHYSIIVPFVFQVSVKFLSASSETFARLRSVRNKGSKGYATAILSRASFFRACLVFS